MSKSRATTDQLATAQSCPKFERCNAAYCPAVGGSHLKGDKVCLYLREAVKTGGEQRLRGTLPSNLAEVVIASASQLLHGTGPLAAELRRAAKSGSKIEQGHQSQNNLERPCA